MPAAGIAVQWHDKVDHVTAVPGCCTWTVLLDSYKANMYNEHLQLQSQSPRLSVPRSCSNSLARTQVCPGHTRLTPNHTLLWFSAGSFSVNLTAEP